MFGSNKTHGFCSQFAFWGRYLLAVDEETYLSFPALQGIGQGRRMCSCIQFCSRSLRQVCHPTFTNE